jgi:hypothetical protein
VLTHLLEDLYVGDKVRIGFEDTHQLLSEISRAGITAQFLQLLRESSQIDCIPSELRNDLMLRQQRIVGQNLYIRRHQEEIYNALEVMQVQIIPIKGISFAERFFGHFAARGTSDIDLLVKVEDVQRVIACLRDLGYEGPVPFNPIHFHCVMWKPVPGTGLALNVEIHWSLMHKNASSLNMEPFWTASSPKTPYIHVRELSTTFTFYAACLHGANHGMRSLKYSLDVAHLLYRFGHEIDVTSLFKTARQDRTYNRLTAVLGTVYLQFPSLQSLQPIPGIRGGLQLPPAWVLRNRFLLVDSWKCRGELLKEIIWPAKGVVLWHLRDDPEVNANNAYLRFYRRRVYGALKRVVQHNKGGNHGVRPVDADS